MSPLWRWAVPAGLVLVQACSLGPAADPPGAGGLARHGGPAVDLAAPPPFDRAAAALDGLGPWPAGAERLAEGMAIGAGAVPALAGDGPLRLTVEDAVLLALRHNRSLSVEQLSPVIAQSFEALERAVYDPELFAEAELAIGESEETDRGTGGQFTVSAERQALALGVRQLLPTGTDLELAITQERSDSDRTPAQGATRVGLTLTQALLRGASPAANLASIHQAELTTLASVYELRGFAEALVAEVETTYWDHVLARRQIAIVEESLAVARQQAAETERRVAVGQLAETERAAARAEVALREQALIDAQSALDQLRLRLLALLNPPAAGWDRMIEALDAPDLPPVPLGLVEAHLALAYSLRPELNQARLEVERGRLAVVQTRNGLLPVLDLFVTLGKSGYAESFGSSVGRLDEPGYDLAAGLRAAYPLGNRAARAEVARAAATRDQALRSLGNLAHLVAQDVRGSRLEVERAAAQIAASGATRAAQEEVLRAEQAKFRVGNGTAFAVAQAQRDLLASQIAEVEAMVDYRRALIALYRLDGTLLLRRGLAAPGDRPVRLAEPGF
jgi:outer membrane protein TolC